MLGYRVEVESLKSPYINRQKKPAYKDGVTITSKHTRGIL